MQSKVTKSAIIGHVVPSRLILMSDVLLEYELLFCLETHKFDVSKSMFI